MIDALIAGKLTSAPEQRTGKNGKPFVTAKVRANGGDGEPVFVNVIGFSDAVCSALLALSEGDSVALTGSLTPKAWNDRDGAAKPALDLVAQQVLTSYAVQRKRRAATSQEPDQEGQFHADDQHQPGAVNWRSGYETR